MPTNSAGAYELPSSYFVQNGDTILPVQHNPPLEDLAAGMTARVMRDGRSVMTGDLKMGANKITGVANAVALTDAATLGQVQNYQGLAGLSYTLEEDESAPPAAGSIRADDFADLSNVTKVWVSATNSADIDFSETILALDPGSKTVKNRILLTVNGQDVSFLVDGATDYTGEATPYVELDVSSHDGSTVLDADTVQLNIEWSGADGEQGDPGADGSDGSDGADGVGVPAGGTTGQVLAKASGTDYDTEWVAQSGGGSGDSWGDAVDADIVPDADGTRDLGATGTRFAETYTDALSVTNNITVGGTVDGRDLASDGSKLDLIEANADVTDAANVNAAGAVMEADYNANTILAATSDDTPAALTVGEQTLVGRITSGNIAALTAAQVRTLINVENGATADQTAQEIANAIDADGTAESTLISALSILTTSAAAAAYQPLDSDLTALAALSTTSYGRAFLEMANQAALFALLSPLSAFVGTVTDDGTKSSGTYTPTPASGGPYKKIVNGGAFTLAPFSPSNNQGVTLSLLIVNNGSAGAITTSGFTEVKGDSFDTTNTNMFKCVIEVVDYGGTEVSELVVRAMQ